MAFCLQRSLRRTLTAKVDDFLRCVREVQATKPAATKSFSSPLPNIHDVFVNNDTGLQYINIYGFDYDYTLASYNSNLESHIYDLGAQVLVEELGYPQELRSKKFDHDFVIKGLHFDRTTGYLLKVDQFGEFQNDTILLGREQVPAEVISEVYQGRRMPQDYESNRLRLLSDIFSLPEACLLADVVQYFRDVKAEFHPLYIYQDVRQALEKLHANGIIHQHIMDHPERYLSKSTSTKQYLQTLANAGKKLFLLSNSPYHFIDRGMSFIYGDDWKALFDVVIASAGKPAWYVRHSKFRRVDESGRQALSGVDEFRRGEIYTQGSLSEFNRITGWPGDSVLYFGDHINSDLFEPQRLGAWKTAAVVKELEREITITSHERFRNNLARLLQIERLIAVGQQLTGDSTVKAALAELKAERNQIRKRLKHCINENFGSIFRTYNAKTHYFYNIARYADIYTSRVSNLMHYPLDATFYTRRAFLPHEAPLFVS